MLSVGLEAHLHFRVHKQEVLRGERPGRLLVSAHPARASSASPRSQSARVEGLVWLQGLRAW